MLGSRQGVGCLYWPNHSYSACACANEGSKPWGGTIEGSNRCNRSAPILRNVDPHWQAIPCQGNRDPAPGSPERDQYQPGVQLSGSQNLGYLLTWLAPLCPIS